MTTEATFEAIRALTDRWVMLNRKLWKIAEKKGVPSDVIASAVINMIAHLFTDLVLRYDRGYHDRLLTDLVQTISKKYQMEQPEPEKRIITLQ